MKITRRHKIIASIVIQSLGLFVNVAYAQLQNVTGSPNNSWRTIGTIMGPGTPVGAIGIGNFPNTTALPSALTINTTLLPAVMQIGETFRTNSNATGTNQNAWRLLTGAGNGTEKFSLFTTGTSNNVALQSTLGNMNFNTGGAITRMTILGNNGNVGIGTSSPVSLLHIDGTNNATGDVFQSSSPNSVDARWRLFTSGAEKFNITVPASSVDVFFNAPRSNSNIFFATRGVTHVQITDGGAANNAGRVAFGNILPNTFVPEARIHLHQTSGNVNTRFTTDNTQVGTADGYETNMNNSGDVQNITYEDNAKQSWHTNNGGTGTVNERMRLYGQNQQGRLLISDDVPSGFVPLDAVHIHNTGTQSYLRFTTTTATKGFNVGFDSNNGYASLSSFEPYAPINFFSSNIAGTAAQKRVTVYAESLNPSTPNGGLAIHTDPNQPVSSPRSYLHIGDYTAAAGWRPWMSIGTFYNKQSDHLYVGLKLETSSGGNQNTDAIINWGDDRGVVGTEDNMRFIYTRNTGIGGNSGDADGKEIVRLTPNGTVGIGDFSPTSAQGPGTANYIGATLDVDGDARIRNVLQDNTNTLTQVLVRDPADLGRIKWRDASSIGGGSGSTSAFNGASIDPVSQKVQLGQDMPVNGTNNAALSNDREIPMGGHNLFFSGTSQNTGFTIIGSNNTSFGSNPTPLISNFGRLNVFNDNTTNTDNIYSASIYAKTTGAATKVDYAIFGDAASSLVASVGLGGQAISSSQAYGSYSEAYSSATSVGVFGRSYNSGGANSVGYGVFGIIQPSSSGGMNAAIFSGGFPSNSSILPATSGNWGGYFNGDVAINGTPISGQPSFTISDSTIKTDIKNMKSSLSIAKQLRPITYKYDNTNAPQLLVNNKLNYGFVAQEVEALVPDLVTEVKIAGDRDNDFNLINPDVTLTALNYDGLIPIAIGAIQELSHTQDSLKNVVDSLANFPPEPLAANGLSIYNGKTVLGQDVNSNKGADFTNDREIPMGGNKIHFIGTDGTSGTTNVINIGYPTNSTFKAKANILQNNVAGMSGGTESYGLIVENKDVLSSAGGGKTFGIKANTIGNETFSNTTHAAGSFESSGALINAGILCLATTNSAFTNSRAVGISTSASTTGVNTFANAGNFDAQGLGDNVGISATAKSGKRNRAILGTVTASSTAIENIGALLEVNPPASPAGGGANYSPLIALKARVVNSGGYVGDNPGTFAAVFEGNVFINSASSSTTGLVNGTSDAMFKTDIDTLKNMDSLIGLLKPVSFKYDTTNSFGLLFPSKKQYGFVAQDVALIFPELVSTAFKPAEYDSLGNVVTPSVTYKTLNYNAFIAMLVSNSQKQNKLIDSLKSVNNQKDALQDARMDALEAMINGCCTNITRIVAPSQTEQTTNEIKVELSDKNAIVLNQNVPNPFAEQTSITYNIPANTGFAQILIYNTNGQLIKAVDVKEKGLGRLNVFANDLSSGAYTYSLFVDGKLIDTKKMVKE